MLDNQDGKERAQSKKGMGAETEKDREPVFACRSAGKPDAFPGYKTFAFLKSAKYTVALAFPVWSMLTNYQGFHKTNSCY